MSKIAKIRDLVSRHPEDDKVVLNDIIQGCIKLQIPLGKLEVHNYKEAVVEAVKSISAVEKKLKLLKTHVRTTVRTEVLEYHNNNKKGRKVHPNSLKNLKQ